MSIKNNINNIGKDIPPNVRLIAVSKTNPVEKIKEAYDAGQRVFGENKVQELTPKYEALPKDIEWHMIGHVQTNKVKYIAPFVHLIHAVDSANLLDEINKQARKVDRKLSCLLQLHIAREESKFGFSEEEVVELLQSSSLKHWENIQVEGLMGMATFTEDLQLVRSEFRGLKNFFDKLKSEKLPPQFQMKELSMGMSGDYKIAIEEGSTMVRVGSAIFGERVYSQK